jgi:diguanylate cyclase (GGDEF)-like protein/PAS domain S-box-containing protein
MSRAESGPILLLRDAGAIITAVDAGIVELLGWRPEELIGRPSTFFIHPEDQASAVGAWMTMLSSPGTVRPWRGRYAAADGSWRWVETVNHNRLDDEGVVRSLMRAASAEQAGVEEELRARTQVFNRLADALPLGVVEFRADGRVSFTNARLMAMLGVEEPATVDALFDAVVDDDRALVEEALGQVLADRPVDHLEIRVDTPTVRVCHLSLRPLTDGDGAVTGAVGCVSDVTEAVLHRHELEVRASIDPLTSCLNRAAILEVLEWELGRFHDAGVAVVFADLDRFKAVNDRYGHDAGDQLLVAAAERLRRAVRPGDQVGRFGGDEFMVICGAVASAADADDICQRVADALDAQVTLERATVSLHASVGVAWVAERVDASELVTRADAAMYSAKRNGPAPAHLRVVAP